MSEHELSERARRERERTLRSNLKGVTVLSHYVMGNTDVVISPRYHILIWSRLMASTSNDPHVLGSAFEFLRWFKEHSAETQLSTFSSKADTLFSE